jgi:predicted transcriptional regulator
MRLASTVAFPYSEAMEVHLTPEQEARLEQIATEVGTKPERLVKDVLIRYLDDEARFLAAVEKGIMAAERGDFIEEEEMDARIERMFKP